MKRISFKIVSLLMVLVLLISSFGVVTLVANAANGVITYTFTGNNKDDKGYAQGTISLSAPAGTYWLYWADDTKALDGYSEIAKLSVSSSASHTMFAQTAIPVNATKVIAINSTSEPATKTVSSAAAVYNIPATKQWGMSESSKKYSFASYSDIHIDYPGSTYAYDDEHWASALDVAAKRGVDFIVTSGDAINNNIDISGIYKKEWQKYSKILADSDYCNPIYEAIGNHELWQDVRTGTKEFIKATGLEGSNNTAEKAYFEKEICGDHFIFMSLEGGFYPDRVEEFSTEQLNWLEGLLKKYSGDGKNIYIIEHSLFYKYGAGDRTDGNPYYDIPLSDNQASTKRFKALLEQYKDTIFISGHTHISFDAQLNYSTNNNTSGQMVHNSSVAGIRKVVNGGLDRNYKRDESEGYIVDVYDDAIIFNGANLHYNEYNSNCCYVVKTSKQAHDSMGSNPVNPTDAPDTQPTTGNSTTGQVSSYYVKGDFNSWGTTNPLYYTTTNGVYETTVKLDAGTYKFKINSGSSWYGNSGTIEDTTKKNSTGGWVMSTSAGDCTLVASGGYYTFNFNTSNSKLNVLYSTTDPTPTEPSEVPTTAPTQKPTEAPTTAPTQKPTEEPTTAPVEYRLGDVNGDENVNIKDATVIQKHIAKLVVLEEANLKAANVNGDNTVNVSDATTIQKFLANLIPSLGKIDKSVADVSASSAVLTSVKENLDLYYRYSSYDCYQALKKAYKSGNADDATLQTLLNALLAVVDENNVDNGSSEITLYFENTNNWPSVSAYCWTGSSSNASWPGVAAKYVGVNSSNNKDVYSYTFDSSLYANIIFNNNNAGKQTVDISVTEPNLYYYLTSTAAKASVASKSFKDVTIK